MTEIHCERCGVKATVTVTLPPSTPISHPADYAVIDNVQYDWARVCVNSSRRGGVLIACPHMRDTIKTAFDADRL
jgi:hypothetical protein